MFVFCSCFGVFFLDFGVFWGVPGVSFFVFFSRNSVICRFSKKLLKAWQAQCFSRCRVPGKREKVTKQGVGTPWKKGCSNATFLRFFMILGCLWASFWGPGATNLGSIFVKFRGGAPGSFLDAFWLPFGRLLGAFWEPWGHLWETLGQFW